MTLDVGVVRIGAQNLPCFVALMRFTVLIHAFPQIGYVLHRLPAITIQPYGRLPHWALACVEEGPKGASHDIQKVATTEGPDPLPQPPAIQQKNESVCRSPAARVMVSAWHSDCQRRPPLYPSWSGCTGSIFLPARVNRP